MSSFKQSQQLIVRILEPLVIGNDVIDNDIAEKIESYNHTISAIGGYDTASIIINDNQPNIEDWLANGLMRHIEIYNPSLVKIWEGFVNEIEVNLGSLTVIRGPILAISNNVAVAYSSIDTSITPPAVGMRTTTDFASDTDSQAKYGQLDGILNTGGVTATEAIAIRDVFLNENKDPQTGQKFNLGQGGISLRLSCLGYYHLFKKYFYNQTASSGETNLNTVLAAIIAADPNGIFSTDTSKITANTLQVKQYQNDNATAWSLIQGLVARGDTSDNRYIFGIYNDRVPIYEAIPTDYEYLQRLSDPAQKVEVRAGIEVKPWDVKAGKWLFVPDFLIGKTLSSSLRLDPRMIFIERVTFTAPWGLNIDGNKSGKLGQKLAKLGLGGIGAGVGDESTPVSPIRRNPRADMPNYTDDFTEEDILPIGGGITIIDDTNGGGGRRSIL